jgi:glycosyltransferase involved in cell wall biosynthesis
MMREAVREELSSRQVDLVCSHFALYARPVLPLVADLPHVVHFHGPWADECSVEGVRSSAIRRIFAWMRRSIERSVYRRANRFIVLSEAFKRILAESYGVNPALIEIIPGGVDIERFNPPQSRIEAREALGWPTDRPIVLAVRRLMTRMGLEELIDSAIDIRAQSPEALVLIAGRGRLGDVLADRVRRQGLSDHVRLTGYLPDDQLPLAYRGADLTVVPSIAMEGFGLVVVESLAAGTPVLVSDVGGLPEVVRDLSEAMVLDRAQPLGKQIESVLNGSLILPSSLECRDHAKRFDWPVIASRVADVYRNVACGRALAGETTTSSGAEIACEMSPGCA